MCEWKLLAHIKGDMNHTSVQLYQKVVSRGKLVWQAQIDKPCEQAVRQAVFACVYSEGLVRVHYLLCRIAVHFSICQTSFWKHLIESDVLWSPSHDLVNLFFAFAVNQPIAVVLQTGDNGAFTSIKLLQDRFKSTKCTSVTIYLALSTHRKTHCGSLNSSNTQCGNQFSLQVLEIVNLSTITILSCKKVWIHSRLYSRMFSWYPSRMRFEDCCPALHLLHVLPSCSQAHHGILLRSHPLGGAAQDNLLPWHYLKGWCNMLEALIVWAATYRCGARLTTDSKLCAVCASEKPAFTC